MSIDFDGLVDSAFQATEKQYREQVFSEGNSVLVPIWLISDISKFNLEDEIFLNNQNPYIDKGFNVPEKIIPEIIDRPLYFHTLTKKHFFLKDELTADVLEIFNQFCETASISDVATHYPENRKYDWESVNKQVKKIATRYEYLSPVDIEENMKLIETAIEELTVSPAMLDYLESFAKSNWVEKYETNIASLILGVSFAKAIPGFTDDNMRELICVLVFKDIGYSRLAIEIKDYELLHSLVSHKILSEANSRMEKELSPVIIDSILKQHEFIDGSGALASRKHPLLIEKNNEITIPLYAQISGICELYNHFYEKEEDSSIAFALLNGVCTAVAGAKGKYEQLLLKQFEKFYYSSLFSESQDIKPKLERKLNKVMDQVGQNWKFIPNDEELPKFEKIKFSIFEDESLDELGKITKMLCILRALASMNKKSISHLLRSLCPYPPQFVQN